MIEKIIVSNQAGICQCVKNGGKNGRRRPGAKRAVIAEVIFIRISLSQIYRRVIYAAGWRLYRWIFQKVRAVIWMYSRNLSAPDFVRFREYIWRQGGFKNDGIRTKGD